MAQSTFDPFPAADLDTNRTGRLADDQSKRFGNLDWAIRKDYFILAIGCAAIAAILLTESEPAPNSWIRQLACAGFGVVAFGR